jgi:cytochrome c
MTHARLLYALALIGLAATPALSTSQPQITASQWNGVFTSAQAERGRVAYEHDCANCHGAYLEGLPQAVGYPGQSPLTPPLVGALFASNWNGMSLGDLFERIRTSMPQQSPGSLRRQTVADILAFMLEQGRYPAGASELPATPDLVRGVTFLKSQP